MEVKWIVIGFLGFFGAAFVGMSYESYLNTQIIMHEMTLAAQNED